MPGLTTKRAVWALGLAAAALALVVVAVPYAASSRLVRDRIAGEIGVWTGYRVEIAAPPEISVWPNLRAVLTGVTLVSWIGNEKPPVIEAERVELDLSAMAALRGEAVFSAVRVLRPTIRIERKGGVPRLAAPGGGRIGNAVETARIVVAADRSAPDTSRLPSNPLGSVSFEDGRIVAPSPLGDIEIVTDLDGRFAWTALDRAAGLNASGVWRGEDVALDLSSPSPLLFLGGATVPISLSMRSAPGNLQFDGSAGLGDAFVDGRLAASSPSLRRLLEWSHAAIAPEGAAGSVEIESRLIGDPQRLRLEDAALVFDGNRAKGGLEFNLNGPVPAVSGTLAFDALDLTAVLSAVTPFGAEGAMARVADIYDSAMVDLRLSAASASLGAVPLTDLAATARLDHGLAAFDISDARAFGGAVQAGLRLDRKAGEQSVEMRLLASDIEGGAMASAAGLTRFVPVGRGKVSVILRGPGGTLRRSLENASGSINASFGPGALAGFDFAAFQQSLGKGGFFSLDGLSQGTLPTQSIHVEASVSRGVATIAKAEVLTDQHRIGVTGLVPYVGRGLALSGSIVPLTAPPQAPAANEATGAIAPSSPRDIAFFVGGTWNAPYVSSAPVRPGLP